MGRGATALRSTEPKRLPGGTTWLPSDVTFAKVDTEDQQELSAGLEITSIPTIMAFRNGYLVFRQSGLLQGRQLDELIEKVKEIDVEDLKKQAEAQKQG